MGPEPRCFVFFYFSFNGILFSWPQMTRFVNQKAFAQDANNRFLCCSAAIPETKIVREKIIKKDHSCRMCAPVAGHIQNEAQTTC